jgi:hypothetical protein
MKNYRVYADRRIGGLVVGPSSRVSLRSFDHDLVEARTEIVFEVRCVFRNGRFGRELAPPTVCLMKDNLKASQVPSDRFQRFLAVLSREIDAMDAECSKLRSGLPPFGDGVWIKAAFDLMTARDENDPEGVDYSWSTDTSASFKRGFLNESPQGEPAGVAREAFASGSRYAEAVVSELRDFISAHWGRTEDTPKHDAEYSKALLTNVSCDEPVRLSWNAVFEDEHSTLRLWASARNGKAVAHVVPETIQDWARGRFPNMCCWFIQVDSLDPSLRDSSVRYGRRFNSPQEAATAAEHELSVAWPVVDE